MLIASKMEEVYPFRLKTIYEKIVHQKIPVKDLVEMECKMFAKLEFNTVTATFFDKIMVQLGSYAIVNPSVDGKIRNNLVFSGERKVNPLNDNTTFEQVESLIALISKFACYNYDLMTSFSRQTITDSVLSLTFEAMNIKVPGVSIPMTTNVEECKSMLFSTIKKFKSLYKGLNNIYKFSNEAHVKKIEEFFSV